MTETIFPPEILKNITPEFIAPLVGVLCADQGPDVTGRLFEAGAGFVSEVRWQRSKGANFKPDESFTPSAVALKWKEIQDFSKDTEYPTGMGLKDPEVSAGEEPTRVRLI